MAVKKYYYYFLYTDENNDLAWTQYKWARQALVVAHHKWRDMTPEQQDRYINYDAEGKRQTEKKMIFAVVTSDYDWTQEPDKALDLENVIKEWSDWWAQSIHWRTEGHRSRYGFPTL